jgi:DNA-binding CsgD family transcriptional regulator
VALYGRQFEILRALLNRERPEDTARRLEIGRRTVDWYRRGIFVHLGIRKSLEFLPLMVAAGTFQMPLPFSSKAQPIPPPKAAVPMRWQL